MPSPGAPGGGFFLFGEMVMARPFAGFVVCSLVLHLVIFSLLFKKPHLSQEIAFARAMNVRLAKVDVPSASVAIDRSSLHRADNRQVVEAGPSVHPASVQNGKAVKLQISKALRQRALEQNSTMEHGVEVGADEPVPPDAVRQYRMNLAKEVRRYGDLPSLARRHGVGGTVMIIVAATKGMSHPQVILGHPGTNASLDTEVLEIMRRVVVSAAMPAVLGGKQFAFNLPIQFSLED